MAEIGNFFVKISSQFDPTGVNATIDALKKVENNTKALNDGFKMIGAAMLGMAATGVIALKDIIKSASDSEMANTRLATALKQTGQFSDLTMNAIKEYAAELQKLTIYTDEQIKESQAYMIQLGVLPRDIKKATQATLDLASATGIDLHQAAAMIGKATDGNIMMFKRYGIELNKTRVETEGVAYITEEVQKKFGGMAKAVGETLTGKITQLKNAFDELKEGLGERLIPRLKSLVDFATLIVNKFETMSPSTKEMITNFILWGTVISTVLGVLFLLIGYLPQLAAGIVMVRGAIIALQISMGGWEIIIAAVVAGLIILVAKLGIVDKIINKVFDASAKTKVQIIKDEIKKLTDEMALMNKSTPEYDAMSKKVKLYTTELKRLEDQQKDLPKAIEKTEKATNSWNKSYAAAMKKMEDNTKQLADRIYDFSMEIQTGVSSAFQYMFLNIQGGWDVLAQGMTMIGQTIRDAIIKQISEIAAEWVTKHALMKAATLAWGAIEWLVVKSISAARAIAGFVTIPIIGIPLGIAAAYALMKEMAGFKAFAEGGMVTGRQFAMIGEAGSEVVLPLNSGNTIKALSGAMSEASKMNETNNMFGGSNINLSVNALTSRKQASALSKIISAEIFNTLKKTRRV